MYFLNDPDMTRFINLTAVEMFSIEERKEMDDAENPENYDPKTNSLKIRKKYNVRAHLPSGGNVSIGIYYNKQEAVNFILRALGARLEQNTNDKPGTKDN